ncbi:MAG: hypothetical protein NPIRA03_16640 [Nitrospirales bacterium]|nr:MAG: hypothetical protein NPIRA03_16640 [Nitrospirales bacterium]
MNNFSFVLKTGLLGLTGVFALTSCIVTRHPFGIMNSTKPLSPHYVILDEVERSTCSPWFLLIPFGSKTSTEDIITDLIKENGADALVGVTVENKKSLFFIPIMGNDCTIVKGQAVRALS